MDYSPEEINFLLWLQLDLNRPRGGPAIDMLVRNVRNPRAVDNDARTLLQVAHLPEQVPQSGPFWPWTSREDFLDRLREAQRHALWPDWDPGTPVQLEPQGNQNLQRRLRHPDSDVRMGALAELDPPDPGAIPDLIELLEDDSGLLASTAADTLAQIGSEAIHDLVLALRHCNFSGRSWAAYALGKMGPAAVSAIPPLQGALSDPSISVRVEAAGALATIDPDPRLGVQTLAQALRDPQEHLRRRAAFLLEDLGQAAVGAVLELVQTLHDPEPPVRQQAAEALRTISERTKIALPPQVEAFFREEPGFQR